MFVHFFNISNKKQRGYHLERLHFSCVLFKHKGIKKNLIEKNKITINKQVKFIVEILVHVYLLKIWKIMVKLEHRWLAW